MTHTQARRPLVAFFLVLLSQAGTADPLHKHGDEGAWIHAGSGWIFPIRIGELARVDAPYTIDGNDDVGVEYERILDGTRTLAIVEVFSRQSAAEHAALDTARVAMERTSGALKEEQSFAMSGELELQGSRLKYAGTADSTASLYFLETDHWVVSVRGTSTGEPSEGTEMLDAFVRALPWETLGSDSGFH